MRLTLVWASAVHLAAGQPVRLLRTVRILNLLFRTQVRTRRRGVATAYVVGLFEAGEIKRIVRELNGAEHIGDPLLNRVIGQALIEDGQPTLARHYLGRMVEMEPQSYLAHQLLGHAYVVEERYAEAADAFARSVAIMPASVMAYQNSAGRYDHSRYRPPRWELEEAGKLLVYDTLGQHAERLSYRGQFAESFRFSQKLLEYQANIGREKELPDQLGRRLAAEFPRYEPGLPIRILPYEWVTQLGHMSMLDAHAKMALLGMLPRANYLLLAPGHKVANPHYLSYFDDQYCVIRDADLVDDLFPYQRYFGDGFIAVRTAGGDIEPWALAAARAQVGWREAGCGPLLRPRPEDLAFGREVLCRLGVPADAWYVGVHVRERGFHSEAEGGAGDHRNADIADYLPAIGEVIRRGGWVVRLGDRTMRPLPPQAKVVDYSASELKSTRMDLFLMATSRMIIGTTSGLTTAAQTFGTQMLLANCISNDWQFWNAETHFILKRVYDSRERRWLSLAETYRQPLQGLLANQLQLRRWGYEVHGNSAGEILNAVRHKLDILDGGCPPAGDDHSLTAAYRRSLRHNPFMFGAAQPVIAFLAAHPELLAAD